MGLYLTEKHIKYKDGKDDHVSPFFIYHINNKRTKVFCSLKVNNKNWCFDKKKVKSTDKEAGLKNRKIKSIKSQLENIINAFEAKKEPLTPEIDTPDSIITPDPVLDDSPVITSNSSSVFD